MDLAKIDQFYKEVSYYKKHDSLSLEEWQFALRKQFGESHYFKIENRGKHSVFTDFDVYNPETRLTYKVAIRSKDNSANFCECNDFKTNGLGTCKHIQAVFRHIYTVANKGHLLDLGYMPAYTSIYLDYRGNRKVKIRIGSEKEQEFKAFAPLYFDDQLTLKENSYATFDEIISKARQISESFRCYPDALEFVIETRERKKRKNLISEKYAVSGPNDAFNKLVKAELFPFQKEGVCFAAEKGRCIIADDMGLGKTIQAIAAAELLKMETGISSTIIICPTSLKYQWKNEIERFTEQKAWVIEGSRPKRLEQYQNDYFYKIVSYNTAVNDIDDLNATSPDLFILDEAQRIKNLKTRISQSIKKLKSPFSFVLTGTPLENKLEDLYSIVQFVNPFILGPFFRFMHDHRMTDEDGKVTGYRDLNRIGELLSETMIRRRKKDVQVQLPERMDKVLYVPMTAAQQQIHNEYQYHVAQLINKWRKQGLLNEKDRQRLMIYLNSMRMVCDSTFILDQKTRNDTKIAELMSILEEVIAEGSEKVVIFSQWERMTRIVAEELEARGIVYESLHGSVPGHERGKIFDTFNHKPECKVFLSTDVGGIGLNLQAGSIIINLDIPWNLAVLEQRIARIYRIGQNKNISVINMVSVDTIEHRMLGVLNFKKGLAEGIFDQGDNTVFLEESKFKVLMDTVEKIIDPAQASETTVFESPDEEIDVPVNQGKPNSGASRPVQQELLFKPILLGDDDVKVNENASSKEVEKPTSPDELLQMGISFFGKLAQTLSDPDTTQKLVSSLLHKDEKDGKDYLKIPVENRETVENALKLIARFINQPEK